ncbi:MAG: undecaprenyl-diphosphate phosphatase [Spirochaetaceae bacterium]|jgi:undecaprenyl-diphosphatase|nr:undecaprenyl-diphosphate phosphatase [Spirochaetaceae bacterium]
MRIFEAIILGAIQGLTEFLPVSSSGHLVLLQKIFHITEPTLLFDTVVHVGTLGAVFIVLWRDIGDILHHPFQRLTGLLIVATAPTVLIALLFKDLVEAAFTSGAFLGFAFLCTGALLFLAQKWSKHPGITKTDRTMQWKDALIIGVFQGVAIVPGVSRSGSTLFAALTRRLDRNFAARFSFLLSIPAILGALVLQVPEVLENPSGGVSVVNLLAGALSAGVVGFFSIRGMLKVVRTGSLWGFTLYVILLGTLILGDQYGTHFLL